MRVLSELEPKNVFSFFEDICNIPHPSYKEDKISNYLVDFAKSRNLEYYQDALNNVIIIKEASKGYEDAAPIILQGHMDMVCEKTPDCDKNMDEDGLDLEVNGDFISAKGTTLGGDDGIAVAYALAFLSLFVTETVDEAIAIQNIFPELSEIFNEMNEYLARPEEVLGMFSEALRILNHNTAVLMVDEYRKKYQEMENNLKKEMKKSQEMQQEMQEMQSNLNKEMQEQQKILDDKDKQINSQEEQHKKDLERIAELEAMLKESRESKESNGQG